MFVLSRRPLTLRGYARGVSSAADTIVIRLRLGARGGGGGVDAYGGVVRRLTCAADEAEGGAAAGGSGALLLLNPLRAKPGAHPFLLP